MKEKHRTSDATSKRIQRFNVLDVAIRTPTMIVSVKMSKHPVLGHHRHQHQQHESMGGPAAMKLLLFKASKQKFVW